jgi:two-component system response regulator LytT
MANAVNITLVEDDFIIANFIEQSLLAMGYNVLAICSSYEAFIKSINQQLPDILLIDIKIEGSETGIDIAEYIRENKDLPFVFISNLNGKKTIDRAKKTLPAAYLIKPFDEDDLYAAIEIALVNHTKKNAVSLVADEGLILKDAIFIKQKNALVKIMKADIVYLEANDNYVKINTQDGTFLIRQTINEAQNILPSYFYRIHRSFIVNMNCIQKIQYEEIVLSNKTHLPLSRNVYADLIDKIQVLKS